MSGGISIVPVSVGICQTCVEEGNWGIFLIPMSGGISVVPVSGGISHTCVEEG